MNEVFNLPFSIWDSFYSRVSQWFVTSNIGNLSDLDDTVLTTKTQTSPPFPMWPLPPYLLTPKASPLELTLKASAINLDDIGNMSKENCWW